MITADSIPGFDPSEPLRFHTSSFGVTLAIVIVLAVVVVAVVALFFGGRESAAVSRPWSHLVTLPTIAAMVLSVMAVLAVVIPVSPVSPARFDACEEAASWADGRYGISLTETNCEDLFKKRGGIFGGSRRTLLSDGTELHAKKVGEQIILTDGAGRELSRSGVTFG